MSPALQRLFVLAMLMLWEKSGGKWNVVRQPMLEKTSSQLASTASPCRTQRHLTFHRHHNRMVSSLSRRSTRKGRRREQRYDTDPNGKFVAIPRHVARPLTLSLAAGAREAPCPAPRALEAPAHRFPGSSLVPAFPNARVTCPQLTLQGVGGLAWLAGQRVSALLTLCGRRLAQIKDGKKVLRCEYTSAQDEWVDFLAPDCSMCGVSVQAGCSCDQLAQEADCFMTDGDVHVGSVETSSGSTSRCSP